MLHFVVVVGVVVVVVIISVGGRMSAKCRSYELGSGGVALQP
jgi:hypothetical protein